MKVAWIGLGTMGGPMAKNLAISGVEVHGVDLSPKARDTAKLAGILIAGSIREAVRGAEAVVTVLPTAKHIREVYAAPEGILANAPSGALLVDCSTVDIETSQWCHDASLSYGFDFVDAPISGGLAKASAGTLTLMLGGNERAIGRVKNLFEPIATHFITAGGPTSGLAAKLCNNLIFYVNMIAAAEGLKLAENLGLDLHVFRKIVLLSSGRSFPMESWNPAPGLVEGGSPADREYIPDWPVVGGIKDIELILDSAKKFGLELAGAKLFESQMEKLSNEGYGNLDFSYLIKLIQQNNGNNSTD